MSLWWAGALLSMVGSIASNLGVNIQKLSFLREAQRRAPLMPRSYTRQPLWMLGLGLVIFGSLGDFAALGLAAQSIVAPIGSITLVSNTLFAHWGLKEPLARRDLGGTVLILLGATLSVAFGNHAETAHTMDELKALYARPLFISYACIMTVAMTLLYATIRKLQPIKISLVRACQQYEMAMLATPRDAALLAQLDSSIATLERRYEPFEKLHPFAYCALSGCLGAQSILFGKMLAEMITASLRGQNQMTYPLTYVFLASMLFCIFAQLHFLALGLSFFDALYVVPVFQCFFILVSVIGGASYFAEFASFQLLQIIFFPAGILLTLTGVFILSARKMSRTGATRERAATGDQLLLVGDLATLESNGEEAHERDGSGRDNLVRAVGGSAPAALKRGRSYKIASASPAMHLLAPPVDSRRNTAALDTDRTIDTSIQIISGARTAANESPVLGPTPLLRDNSNDLNMQISDEPEVDAEPDSIDADDSPPAAAHTEPRVKFFIPTGGSALDLGAAAAASNRHKRNQSSHGAAASSAAAAVFMPSSSSSSLDDDMACAVSRPPVLDRVQSRFARRYSQLLDLTALEDESTEDAGPASTAAAPCNSTVGSTRHSRHATLDGPSLLALMSSQHEDAQAVIAAAHRRTRSSFAPAAASSVSISASAAAAAATVSPSGAGRKLRRGSLGSATLWDAGTAVLGSRPPSPPPPQPSSLDELLEL